MYNSDRAVERRFIFTQLNVFHLENRGTLLCSVSYKGDDGESCCFSRSRQLSLNRMCVPVCPCYVCSSCFKLFVLRCFARESWLSVIHPFVTLLLISGWCFVFLNDSFCSDCWKKNCWWFTPFLCLLSFDFNPFVHIDFFMCVCAGFVAATNYEGPEVWKMILWQHRFL